MSHGVPCVGYVVEEQSRPGRLRNEVVEPIVKRNMQALKDAGFKIPMKAMAIIKNLPEGAAFSFPDGSVLTQEDAVEAPRSGRKVVICGDTADARSLTNLAMNADVVVHEATNTYLDFLDKNSDTLQSVTKDSMSHGHSTPQLASDFAKRVNAKRLLLNHFSPRYKGDQETDSISIMTRIEHQAMKATGFDASRVAAAWDFMLLPIPQR
jgi:ribonuclease Z